MAERKGEIIRKTNETSVSVRVDIDGTGKSTISTGVGFFDHMLDQTEPPFADRHGYRGSR